VTMTLIEDREPGASIRLAAAPGPEQPRRLSRLATRIGGTADRGRRR
jgi:hypothetical protein